jgi:hypothetical protein
VPAGTDCDPELFQFETSNLSLCFVAAKVELQLALFPVSLLPAQVPDEHPASVPAEVLFLGHTHV